MEIVQCKSRKPKENTMGNMQTYMEIQYCGKTIQQFWQDL